MSDLPTDHRADQHHANSGAVRNRRTPAWVKALGIVVLVLLMLLVVSQFFGIQHGPDLHRSLLAPLRPAFVAAFSAA
jgi:type VI protein secretion system component VasF